jgi:hypothetical protein
MSFVSKGDTGGQPKKPAPPLPDSSVREQRYHVTPAKTVRRHLLRRRHERLVLPHSGSS